MRCEEARFALHPQPGHHDASPEAVQALQHLAECEACRRFFSASDRLQARLGRLGHRVSCPPHVLERARAAIRNEAAVQGGPRRARPLLLTGAGLLAAAAATLLILGRPGMPASAVQPLVAEAQADLGASEAISSSDHAEVERWLGAETGFEVALPRIAEGTLMGGRVFWLEGAPAAAAVYEYHGKPVTYFVLSSSGVGGRPIAPDRVVSISSSGYEVALWVEGGAGRGLAAAMPRADVMIIAEECRRKAAPRATT